MKDGEALLIEETRWMLLYNNPTLSMTELLRLLPEANGALNASPLCAKYNKRGCNGCPLYEAETPCYSYEADFFRHGRNEKYKKAREIADQVLSYINEIYVPIALRDLLD